MYILVLLLKFFNGHFGSKGQTKKISTWSNNLGNRARIFARVLLSTNRLLRLEFFATLWPYHGLGYTRTADRLCKNMLNVCFMRQIRETEKEEMRCV